MARYLLVPNPNWYYGGFPFGRVIVYSMHI